ncbi:MAG: histidine--tRNA ligase [Bacillota bacterium]|nr:histidine--tRNA ligase [Bacillota bacterium]
MNISKPRGTNDFLPPESSKILAIEQKLRELCAIYNYQEIRTPIFEDTELFVRGVGNATDIVQKEMYTFLDQGERSLTLRPENTAAACRAYIENKLYGLAQPVKLFYIGPMFRYERPQAGRFRQFHQFGLELFGSAEPAADAEIISFAWRFYQQLGIRDLNLRINSVGCPNCRAAYKRALQDYFRPHLAALCGSCRDRFERNPLRLLDCKSQHCHDIGNNAPQIYDYLCGDCSAHFAQLKTLLDAASLPYALDWRMVRGLDYYTKTAFEIEAKQIGAQSAVCGGGRYDGLIEEIGGAPTPAVGFALGIERIFTALKAQGDDIDVEQGVEVFLISHDNDCKPAAFRLCEQLRAAGFSADMEYGSKSLKAQMKAADRMQAAYTLIIGGDELLRGEAVLRNMDKSEQITLPVDNIVSHLLRIKNSSDKE